MTTTDILIKKIYQSNEGNIFSLPYYEHVPVEIPDWDTYFFFFAYLASLRSKDAQTKCGCVLVNERNHIVGTGYNSFVRGMPDELLPNTRPLKYPFFNGHSEINAILNAEQSVNGCKAYVTGPPCFSCLSHMVQAGIKSVYAATNISKVKMVDEDQNKNCSILAHFTSLQIHMVDVDFRLWPSRPE